MTPAEVAAITDPVERARTAQQHLVEARRQTAEYLTVRDAAMVAMRTESKMTQRAVAAALGLSPGLVAQVDEANGVKSELTYSTNPDRSTTT